MPAVDPSPTPGLVLGPFRGLRFDAAQVGDLGTVVSPPYDVLDADTVRDLETANRRNIVRLILSRRFEAPYKAVLKRLNSWRQRGFLVPDPEPALYLYEYAVGGATVRGLIGLAGLRGEQERVVLPHEEVMAAPVEDRVVLMRTTRTNLEPILLVHQATETLRTLLDGIAATPPLAAFTALDGSAHRLWALTEPDRLDLVAAELAGDRALIADGHHRWAAYLRLQQELRDPDAPEGADPWDAGLAMLVDQGHSGLHVGPIHRSVGALTLADLQDLVDERAADGDRLEEVASREEAFRRRDQLASDEATVAFVVADGRRWGVLSTPRTAPVDAVTLHERLLPAWHVHEQQIGYHHSLDQALHTVAQRPGLVVAVTPPTVAQVTEAAALGVRMPRKSTSFAPKPRMGVVMRDLRDT